MHILTLSSLALALGALTIHAKETPSTTKSTAKPTATPAAKSKQPLPFYNWEHRTTCMQDLTNPRRNDQEELLNFDVMVVGYAWDETNGLTPDHKWNWNSTANANKKILENIGYAGIIPDDDNKDRYHNGNYVFESGEPDDLGFTQFTVEFNFLQMYTLVDEALNLALGIQGMKDSANAYESIVCLDRESPLPESEGGPPERSNREEQPYMQVEDEMQLEKQRFEQLHKDRVMKTDKELADSDRFIQENADKASRKTPEMEESDRRIQSIPLVIQGLPPKERGNSTA